MTARNIPILFSGPMVRAILNGRKTQTRRVLKPRGRLSLFDGSWSDDYVLDPGNAKWREDAYPWRVGDRLWVRECIGRRTASFLGIEATNGVEEAYYLADDADVVNEHGFNLCPWWKAKALPSIHMPRWASRITLDVTGVKVERLQDISEEDALAEGAVRVDPETPYGNFAMFHHGQKMDPMCDGFETAKASFRHLWKGINDSRPGCSWDENPWVVAISFRRVGQ